METEYVPTPLVPLATEHRLGKAENKLWKKLKNVLSHKLVSHSNYVVYNARRKAFLSSADETPRAGISSSS